VEESASAGGAGGELGDFGPPVAVAELNSADFDDDPTLTADMLEICFESKRKGGPGGSDIWCATRASVDAGWSPPVVQAALSTPHDESSPELSADGLFMFLGRTGPGTLDADLFYTVRASRAAPWAVPLPADSLNSERADLAAAVTPDLLRLYMGSNRPGVGSWDLYRAERADTLTPFDPPVLVAELGTASGEANPWSTPDESMLFFNSDRSGGAGGNDLWLAVRSPAGILEVVGPLAGINSDKEDNDPWLSPDLRVIFFTSDRGGSNDIYMATR
jgi:hypothetical protein